MRSKVDWFPTFRTSARLVSKASTKGPDQVPSGLCGTWMLRCSASGRLQLIMMLAEAGQPSIVSRKSWKMMLKSKAIIFITQQKRTRPTA